MSIHAIKEAVRKDLSREMASKQQEVEETVGLLKRKLDNLQVLQVQHDTRSDNRGPPPNRGRGRGGRGGDRSTRGQSSNDRVRLPEGVCSKCGSKDHVKCVWREPCDYCKQVGHKDVVCYRRIRDEGSRTGAK
jgi:hypothetical protein